MYFPQVYNVYFLLEHPTEKPSIYKHCGLSDEYVEATDEIDLYDKIMGETQYYNDSMYESIGCFLADTDQTAMAYLTKHVPYFHDCEWVKHEAPTESGWRVHKDGAILVFDRLDVDSIEDADQLEDLVSRTGHFLRYLFSMNVFKGKGYVIPDVSHHESDVVEREL